RDATERKRYVDDLVNELAAAEAEYAGELAKEFTEEAEPEESIFDSEISKRFEQELREKGYIGEPVSDFDDLEEELAEPEYLYDWSEEPEPEYPPFTFTHMQPEESIFDSPLSKRFEREIREYGEVQEYGLGKHW